MEKLPANAIAYDFVRTFSQPKQKKNKTKQNKQKQKMRPQNRQQMKVDLLALLPLPSPLPPVLTLLYRLSYQLCSNYSKNCWSFLTILTCKNSARIRLHNPFYAANDYSVCLCKVLFVLFLKEFILKNVLRKKLVQQTM